MSVDLERSALAHDQSLRDPLVAGLEAQKSYGISVWAFMCPIFLCAPRSRCSRVDSSVFGGYDDRWERIDTLTPRENRIDGSGFQKHIPGTERVGEKSL